VLPPRFFAGFGGGFEVFVETAPHHDMRYPLAPGQRRAA
jgi:hypothetical protein